MPFEKVKAATRVLIPRNIRNWIRSPRKTAEWLWDDVRFKLGITKILQLPNGRSLVCHPRAYKAALGAQICDPEQSGEFRQFLSHCREGMLFFDVGANFGIFSLAAADFGGRAVAIEPSPIGLKMIAAQVRLNGLTDSVEVVAAAAGATEGSIRMLSSGIFSDGYLRVADGRPRRETTSVDVTTLDLVYAKFGPPSHLKIDVEGYEETVLRGAQRLLGESSPLIFLEIHNEMVAASGGDPNFSVDELLRLGYRIFSTAGAPISRQEALSVPINRVVASRE